MKKHHKKPKNEGVAEGLNEFAPPSGDDGDDGFSDETLKRMAAQWWNGDQDPRVERTLMAAGWEIGQDEGYEDEPGVFVVQAGDINGNSYISWPAEELRGLLEDAEDDIASNAAMIAGPGSTDLTTPKPTATPMAAPTATATPTATPTATTMGSNEIKDLQNKLIAGGEKIKADGIMGPRTQAALNRYNAKTSSTTPAQPKPAANTTAAPATAVQSGSGSPIRTGSGGYVVSPDYAVTPNSTPQSPYDHDLMLAAIKNRESGGDPNAVSRVGAVGTMQTMPHTLRDPGFGVKAARDNSPQELERVGKDYYGAMLKNYNDPKVALAAYNWGPGNVNKWLKAGGDFNKLPRETRAYVKNIMGDYTAAQSTKMASANRPSVSETRGKDQDQFGGMHQDDFQEKLIRLKQLANAGPLKTVRDPLTGHTRNVPANSLPKKSTPK
jgi:soluble lytic murein transglycosylase-like protein